MSAPPLGQKRQRYDSDSDVEETTTTVEVVRDDEPSRIPPKATPVSAATSPPQQPVSSPPVPAAASKGKRRAAPAAMVFAAGRVASRAAPPPSNLISGAPSALSLIERMKNQLGGGGGGGSGMGDPSTPLSSFSTNTANTNNTNAATKSSDTLLDEGTLFNHGKQTQALDDALNNLTPNKRAEEEEDVGSSDDDADTNHHHRQNNNHQGTMASASSPRPSTTSPKLSSSKAPPVQPEDPSARDVIRKVRSDDRAWARSLQVGGGTRRPLLLASVVEYTGDAGFVDEDMGKSNSHRSNTNNTSSSSAEGGVVEGNTTATADSGVLSSITRALQMERFKDAHDRLGYRLLRAKERVDTIGSVIGFGGDGAKGDFTEDVSTTTSATATTTTITATNENINQLIAVELKKEPLLAEYATLVQNGSLHCSFVGDSNNASTGGSSEGGFLVNGRGGIGMNSGTGLSIADLRGNYSSSLDDRHYMLGPLHTAAASKITSPTSPSGPGALPLPVVVSKDRFGVAVQQVPQEYEIAASSMMGMERVCSGWRWDGIIRGNTRILDHYRPHHNHSHDIHGL